TGHLLRLDGALRVRGGPGREALPTPCRAFPRRDQRQRRRDGFTGAAAGQPGPPPLGGRLRKVAPAPQGGAGTAETSLGLLLMTFGGRGSQFLDGGSGRSQSPPPSWVREVVDRHRAGEAGIGRQHALLATEVGQ